VALRFSGVVESTGPGYESVKRFESHPSRGMNPRRESQCRTERVRERERERERGREEKKRANPVRGGSCQAALLPIGEIARVCIKRCGGGSPTPRGWLTDD